MAETALQASDWSIVIILKVVLFINVNATLRLNLIKFQYLLGRNESPQWDANQHSHTVSVQLP